MPIHGNLGGFIKPGFNPLGPQTEYLYEMYAWGYNGDGQLGLGDTTNRSSPVQVGALTTWSQVAGGLTHTLATTTGGALYAWGNNNEGRLGLGNTTYYSSPVQVGALTTWSVLPKMPQSESSVILQL